MRRWFAAFAAPMILMATPLAALAQSAEPPASASPGASIDPGVVRFTGSGPGGMRTEPFTLEPGDHRLTYEVRAPGDEAQCGMGFALLASDGGYFADIGNNGAYVAAGAPYRNETWFHVPTSGTFAFDVGGDCDWDATLAQVASPLDAGVPFTRTGSGPAASPSFPLEAGDHVIRYVATNPSATEQCIFFGPGIVDQDHGSQMMGDPVDAVVDPGATLEGEVAVPGLPAGRYSLFINYAWCSSGLAEPIAWTVTIDRS